MFEREQKAHIKRGKFYSLYWFCMLMPENLSLIMKSIVKFLAHRQALLKRDCSSQETLSMCYNSMIGTPTICLYKNPKHSYLIDSHDSHILCKHLKRTQKIHSGVFFFLSYKSL